MFRKITVSMLCFVISASLSAINPVYGNALDDVQVKQTVAKGPEKKNKSEKSNKNDTQTTNDLSLAKRICGNYSYYDEDYEEFETLSFVAFGDNLCAFAGLAKGEKNQKEDLDIYSYWAAEFIPDDEEEARSTDSDSMDFNALYYSNMSMLSQYQGDAEKGTITLTKDGVSIEYDNGGQTVYKKDDRVTEAFPYLDKKDSAGDKDLQGYWRLKGADYPVYLFFDGGNMYVYEKIPGLEAEFYAGNYSASKNMLSAELSTLVSAGMPYDFEAEFTVKKDVLTILGEDTGDFSLCEEGDEFERIDEEDVPVMTADEYITPDLDPDADPDTLYFADPDSRPFYGVFVSTLKDREDAVREAGKLCDKGYYGSVTYTPEWEKLNQKPYFAVIAGRFDTKEDADEVLKEVKKEGYKDAFVKYSGRSQGFRVNYTTFSPDTVSIREDAAVIRFGDPVPTYDWSEYYVENGYDTGYDYLYLDEDTVFAEDCDMEFFSNYKKGDTVLDWYKRNEELISEDPENNDVTAYVGVFDVTVDGNYIESVHGIYWWD
ncbi:MAG: SPOR domain-containing protein [Lachnospiraceae bacterium]|nr:SPOR domain-containing protein [Lachnospiraceae bacterium]